MSAHENPTSLALTAVRHIVGMVLAAFICAKVFAPAMLQGAGFAVLASALGMALVSAALICGLLALFFTGFARRIGKAGMARIFFALAWLVLVLALAGLILAIKLPASAPADTAHRAPPPAAPQTAAPAAATSSSAKARPPLNFAMRARQEKGLPRPEIFDNDGKPYTGFIEDTASGKALIVADGALFTGIMPASDKTDVWCVIEDGVLLQCEQIKMRKTGN